MGIGTDIIRDLVRMTVQEAESLRDWFARHGVGRVSPHVQPHVRSAQKKPARADDRSRKAASRGASLTAIIGDLVKVTGKDLRLLGLRTRYAAEDGFDYIKKTPRRWRRMSPERRLASGLLAAAFGIAAAFALEGTGDRVPDSGKLTARDVETFVRLQPELIKIFAMPDEEYLKDLKKNKRTLDITRAFSAAVKGRDGMTVLDDGTRIWTQRGQLSRGDGPAVIYPDGKEVWMVGNSPWSRARSKADAQERMPLMQQLDALAKQDHARVKKARELRYKQKRGIRWTKEEWEYVNEQIRLRDEKMREMNKILGPERHRRK